ncbi:MAG: hypothetical protein PHN69_00765 [Candidatus Pacebacteria bacterium]|nr:hypothetical protein [Candidatus Paceibacterota bacterium]
MKKIKFKKSVEFLSSKFILGSVALLSMTEVVMASGPVIQNPLGDLKSVPVFVSDLLSYVVKIGGIVAIFAFIYSGYLFVKARGNPKELETAKTVFKNTIIGVAVLLGAQLIASIIIGTIKNLKQ